MKNLPGIILVATPISLAGLVVASSLGVIPTVTDLAAPFVATSSAIGVCAMFLKDYAPRSSERPAAPAPRPAPRRHETPVAGAFAALRMTRDPATVTLH